MKFNVVQDLTIGILTTALFLILSSTAHPASKITKIKPNLVYKVSDGKTTYQCVKIKGKPFPVIKEGKAFYKGSDAIQRLKDRMRGISARAKKVQRKKLNALKAKVKTAAQVCSNGGGGGGGNTGGTTLTKLNRAITRDDVALLLDKAGFGLSAGEEDLVTTGVSQGVEALVDAFMKTKDEPSGLIDRVNDRLDGQMNSTTTQTPAGQRQAILDLWTNTNNPFAEKFAMTLLSIWTVSGEVIEDETFRSAFWDYFTRLRSFSFGDITVPDLAVEITKDPLMLIYLNNDLNVKGNANENFARELMELFTLGPTDLDGNPNYSETATDGSGDIAVAARMLTGWKVKKDYTINKLVPEYVTSRHQPGPHTMFAGKSYAFTGENDENLVRGIFANHPGVKNYYAQEILKLYLTANPPRELVEAFGGVIAKNNFKLRPAMKELFMSEAFYNPIFKDTIPIDPYTFVARVTRVMKLRGGINLNEIERQTRRMGFEPNLAPSVFWYPQDAWNSSNAILEKANAIAQLFNDQTAQGSIGWTPQTMLPQGAVTNAQLLEFVKMQLGLKSFTAGQEQTLASYLTTQRIYNGSYVPFTYSNTNLQHQRNKGLGLFYLMLLSPESQLL